MSEPCRQEASIATLTAQDRALTEVLHGIQAEVIGFRQNQEKQLAILTQLAELSVKNQVVLESMTRMAYEIDQVATMTRVNAAEIVRVENSMNLKLAELSNDPAKKTHKTWSTIKVAIVIAVANAILIPVILKIVGP
jgi:hypothetical protein